jgi:hypothetical protein
MINRQSSTRIKMPNVRVMMSFVSVVIKSKIYSYRYKNKINKQARVIIGLINKKDGAFYIHELTSYIAGGTRGDYIDKHDVIICKNNTWEIYHNEPNHEYTIREFRSLEDLIEYVMHVYPYNQNRDPRLLQQRVDGQISTPMGNDDDLLAFLSKKGFVCTCYEYVHRIGLIQKIVFERGQISICYFSEGKEENLAVCRTPEFMDIGAAMSYIMVMFKATVILQDISYTEQKQFLFDNYDTIMELYNDNNFRATNKKTKKISEQWLKAVCDKPLFSEGRNSNFRHSIWRE